MINNDEVEATEKDEEMDESFAEMFEQSLKKERVAWSRERK